MNSNMELLIYLKNLQMVVLNRYIWLDSVARLAMKRWGVSSKEELVEALGLR